MTFAIAGAALITATEAGRTLKVTVSQYLKEIHLADTAKVVLPKVEAGNGIVYPIDTVLWPAALLLRRR